MVRLGDEREILEYIHELRRRVARLLARWVVGNRRKVDAARIEYEARRLAVAGLVEDRAVGAQHWGVDHAREHGKARAVPLAECLADPQRRVGDDVALRASVVLREARRAVETLEQGEVADFGDSLHDYLATVRRFRGHLDDGDHLPVALVNAEVRLDERAFRLIHDSRDVAALKVDRRPRVLRISDGLARPRFAHGRELDNAAIVGRVVAGVSHGRLRLVFVASGAA
jgi:hypothetical protein